MYDAKFKFTKKSFGKNLYILLSPPFFFNSMPLCIKKMHSITPGIL